LPLILSVRSKEYSVLRQVTGKPGQDILSPDESDN
jgi:hypothetical protein